MNTLEGAVQMLPALWLYAAYIGDRGAFERWFPAHGYDTYFELRGFAWWSGWRVLGYVIMPLIAIAIMPRCTSISDHPNLKIIIQQIQSRLQ